MADKRPNTAPIIAFLSIALWLGAALFFAAAVAPALFGTLPSSSMAGSVVRRLLPILFVSGMFLGVFLIALELRGSRTRHFVTRSMAALLLILACGVAQLSVAPRIARARALAEQAGHAATSAPASDFGKLHMQSVAWLGVAILAGVSFTLFAGLGLANAIPIPEKLSSKMTSGDN